MRTVRALGGCARCRANAPALVSGVLSQRELRGAVHELGFPLAKREVSCASFLHWYRMVLRRVLTQCVAPG